MTVPTKLYRLVWLLLLCCCATATAGSGASDGIYKFEAVPSWVNVAQASYESASPPGDVSDGTWYLMVDHQIKVDQQGDEDYRHIALKVVNTAGVDEQSQINFNVDPSYQSLSIHTLSVLRDGAVIDQRSMVRTTVLPQESELEQRIYNGGYKVNLVLSDVRVGDVIEYAYTLRSVERLFPGHYADRMMVGWSEPVRWQRVRLLYPDDRPMRYRFSTAAISPQTRRLEGQRELVFEWHDVAGIRADEERPGWHMPWPLLEFSDFADWSEVAQRESRLYRLPTRSRPRLDAAVAKLQAADGTPEQKVLRALQLVQEDVRYTSISIGVGSHTPTDPETVLERRFGDCKDKSLLLAILLQRLGIDARPALVHSEHGLMLPQSLPAPFVFNHAIVRVRLGADVYWLDGTFYKQYSALQKLEPADYSYGLPLDPDSRGLEQIPRPASGGRGREVQMAVDLSKGLFEPATFDVTTRYIGASADYMRNSLTRQNAAERQANYLNYYARHYPGLKSAAPMTIEDDTDSNVLVTLEHYLIEKTFTKDKTGASEFSVHADEMYRYGDALKASVRNSPLGIEYPNHVKQIITLHLPEDWGVDDNVMQIDNPAFRYRSEVSHVGRKVTLAYEYEALADHVGVDALAQYEADRAKLYGDTDFRFTRGADSKRSTSLAIAPTPFFVGLVSVCLGIWLMRRFVYRYDPPRRVAAIGAPVGIEGWLVLPALNVIASPLVLLYLLSQFAYFVDADTWDALPIVVSEGYSGIAQAVALVFLGFAGVILPFSITVLLLFFRRRTSAPLLFIALLLTVQLYSVALIGVFAASGIEDADNTMLSAETVREAIFTAIWVAYMIRANRVKATFVVRLQPEPQPAEPTGDADPSHA